jgi:hypothetical protein
MNIIDQAFDDRDALKVKLRKANAKLRRANARIDALTVVRDHALQTVERANAANIRARAMICDAAGIPHDADILEWIGGARERIARLEAAGDALNEASSSARFDTATIRKRLYDAMSAWTAAKEAKP